MNSIMMYTNRMFEHTDSVFTVPEIPPYAKLIRKLAETFVVRDVMVHLPQIEYVAPGDEFRANRIVEEKRYSVVPASKDGEIFESVFCTEREAKSARRITEERQTSISDYIPESTPLTAAFFLFRGREWYFTLRNNQVSGLVTYWTFNSREFRLLLYAGLSRVEELSRDVLAKDGCGVLDEKGLNLTQESIAKIKARMKPTWLENGGNKFVDELDYHQINTSLKKHLTWRAFLSKTTGIGAGNGEYDRSYNFTELRDEVMHGRVLFPTYRKFRENIPHIQRIDHLVALLDEYLHADNAQAR
jgi:hypothetical protein